MNFMKCYNNTKLSLMLLVTCYKRFYQSFFLIEALIKYYSSTLIVALGARCPS